MNITTAATVQTFTVSDSEWVQVDRSEPDGDYVVRLIVNGNIAQERWAWGNGTSSRGAALQNGEAWAAAMRADRAWMTR